MYIQALKSLISKFMQVKKMETELLKKGVDKELINYAKLCCKNAAQETEIYNSYDILLHVYITFDRSMKIGWPIDKMDVENIIIIFKNRIVS